MSLALSLRSFHRGGNSMYGSAASSLSGDDTIDSSSCSTLSLASSLRSLTSSSRRRKGRKPKPAVKIVKVHEVDDDQNKSLTRGRSTTNRARSGTRTGQRRRRRRSRTGSRIGSRTKEVRRETEDSVTEINNASRRYKVRRTKSSMGTKVRNTESKSKNKSGSNSISSISGHSPSDHGRRRERRHGRQSEVAPRREYTSTASFSSFQHATRTVSPLREAFFSRPTSLGCVLESQHATSRSLRRGRRPTHSRRPTQDRF